MPKLVGHRLSAAERRDLRLLLGIVGALLVLLSYAVPMFPNRITWAQVRFSGGTVLTNEFPMLITGQHYAQAHHPPKEEFEGVAIRVAPVEVHSGSGWGWLWQMIGQRETWAFLSYLLCILLPLMAALLMLLLVGIAWSAPRGLPEALIPPSIWLSALVIPSLLLAWLHQFDFSTQLLTLERAALTPRLGFWGALLGGVLLAVAALRLRSETRRDVLNWWALVFVIALGVWLLVRFKPQPYLEIWRFISDGIVVTLRITTTSFGFILLVSLLGGLGRISRSRLIYGLASLYVEIIRGIPLLVQLLFIWFALPQVFDALGQTLISLSPHLAAAGQWLIDLRLNPFTAAVLGLTICYGADPRLGAGRLGPDPPWPRVYGAHLFEL